jgi:hypothetical protein
MPDVLQLALAFLCSTCGMALLALAMRVHWQQVRDDEGPSASAALVLRSLGAFAVALSLWVCLQVDHGSMAALVWVMSLAASASIVAFTLTWRPGWLGWLALGASRLLDRSARITIN